MEIELNMTASREKTSTVANRPATARAIADAVTDGIAKASTFAKVLGTDALEATAAALISK